MTAPILTPEQIEEIRAGADFFPAEICDSHEALRAERDAKTTLLDQLEGIITAKQPPDHVFRFFQRLHGLPETGAPEHPAEVERDELRRHAEALADAMQAAMHTLYVTDDDRSQAVWYRVRDALAAFNEFKGPQP